VAADWPGLKKVEEAGEYLSGKLNAAPRVGLILGSGLRGLVEEVSEATTVDYGQIPHFPSPSVKGHEGRLVAGELTGQPVAAMSGRPHYYEGYTMEEVVFPVRVLAHVGVETLIVTNAAGGLNPEWDRGDVMVLSDHISLVGMAGANPLRGAGGTGFGPRFVPMTNAYNLDLRELASRVAREQSIPCREGVYAMVAGPSFETPAEIRALRTLGADAVGMSTAPEVVAARQAGMRVLGLSLITNIAASDANHDAVLEAGRTFIHRLGNIVLGVLGSID
jgi:purine-nucleoside phosphorylase